VEHREVPTEEATVKLSRNNEETAQGPESSCRATWRAKGIDPRRLWIPEEVGCHLQEGGTVRVKCLQENCGLQKELAAAGRKMTRCARVAQRKGHRLQGHSHEGPSVEQGRQKK
jgi:hypothetical protein